ncbi:PP2C family protein-serine/threonine phosphatase [Haliangium sp.]|uniref:PP2C family protein-serine/threonine phosphatase n=1 Tax=Haliangium sp. TaxID=2663208 RepID=UPI003D0D7874
MESPRATLGPTWPSLLLLALPTALLLGAAAAIGPERVSAIVLMVTAAVYTLAALILFMPWMARVAGERRAALAELGRWFRDQAMSCESGAELALLLGEANHRLGYSDRALIVTRDSNDELRVFGGNEHDAVVLHHSDEEVARLADDAELVTLDSEALRPESASLLGQLGCRAALPLRHGDRSLGLALVGEARRRVRGHDLRADVWLRTAASLALARQTLGFDLQHRVSLKSSLDYARATQEALMPEERPFHSDGFVVHGVFRPAAQCGGDLWLWRRLGPGRVLVVLGDVTGHGVAPAMLSAAVAGVLQIRAIADGDSVDPADMLRAIDESIHRVARGSYMMTAFVAVFDREAGVVNYANAAQSFPIMVVTTPGENEDEDEVKLQPLIAPGPMLGAGSAFEVERHQRPLRPGTRVVMYTDGIVEAERAPGQAFGERRLRRLLTQLAPERPELVAPRILEEVDQFLGNATPDDDMTVVVVDLPSAREHG